MVFPSYAGFMFNTFISIFILNERLSEAEGGISNIDSFLTIFTVYTSNLILFG